VFGTLAAIYRAMVDAPGAGSAVLSKRAFYEGLAQAARQTISALVDLDGRPTVFDFPFEIFHVYNEVVRSLTMTVGATR